MKPIQSTRTWEKLPNSETGVTLVELLVGSLVALIILGVSLSLINTIRREFLTNQARSEAGQNLRVSMDILGTDIRRTGENLDPDISKTENLPVIKLFNNSSANGADTLVLQRRIKIEANQSDVPDPIPVLNIMKGSNNLTLTVKDTSTNGPIEDLKSDFASIGPDGLDDYLVKDYRDNRCQQTTDDQDNDTTCNRTSTANTVSECSNECLIAYLNVYNIATSESKGEFFYYTFEECINADNNGQSECDKRKANDPSAGEVRNVLHGIPINDSPDSNLNNSFYNDLTGKIATVYFLNQSKYELVPDPNNTNQFFLELTEIGKELDSFRQVNIMNNMSDFQVSVLTDQCDHDENFSTPFTTDWCESFNYDTAQLHQNWQDLERLRVSLALTASNEQLVRTSDRKLTSEFFPRNRIN